MNMNLSQNLNMNLSTNSDLNADATSESVIEEVLWLAEICTKYRWLPATSGNLSVLIEANPLQFAITRSGADKQNLKPTDVLIVNEDMQVLNSDEYRPSAETAVHIALYKTMACKSIVHVHTVYNNLISEICWEKGYLKLQDLELLKAFGYWEEDAQIQIPIVTNHSQIPQLAAAVQNAISPGVPGVLVRNHGIYAWGDSASAAKRHLEAFEFLFEYQYRLLAFYGQSR